MKILPTVLIEPKTKILGAKIGKKGKQRCSGKNLQAEASFPKGLFHETESQIGAKHRQTNGRENDSRRHCLGVNAQVSCPGKQGLMPKVRAVADQPNAHQNLHREKPLDKSVFLGKEDHEGGARSGQERKNAWVRLGAVQKKIEPITSPSPVRPAASFFRLFVPLSLRR